jgi:hypothetical protein
MKLLDVIATLNPIPTEELSLVESEYVSIDYLPRGQVGTIVEMYENGSETYYLVEFSDRQGREYAMATLKEDEMIVLHYELQIA